MRKPRQSEMPAKPIERPSAGGSYIRQADGSLQRSAEPQTLPEHETQAAGHPAPIEET